MAKTRFAILAGVSTDSQAKEEKQSIADQIKNCRARIAQLDGVEAAGPFVMDGYSRTGYDSLEIAMQDIPPLADAINSARANAYDVLIMDHFDRLGDLAHNVIVRFAKLRKQLYSARQSNKLSSPTEYDPYASEDTEMAVYAQQIIQAYRIKKIRRGWNIGVPDRAAKGLHPLSIPFGYKKQAAGEPAVQVKNEVNLIRRMLKKYLNGETLESICDMANASGIKPSRSAAWQRQVIKRMMINPYYAGLTIFGRYKTIDGKRIPQPPSTWKIGKGLHKALWDEDTYAAIIIETERRESIRARSDRYALTGVCTCAVCDAAIHRHGKKQWVYISCSAQQPHVSMRYERAIRIVADAVVKELRAYKENKATPVESIEKYDQLIAEQKEQRARVQQAFERGKVYTEEEAHLKIVAIETETNRLIRSRERAVNQQVQKEAMLKFANQDLERLHTWLLGDEQYTINLFLTNLCETIKIFPDGKAQVIWRE